MIRVVPLDPTDDQQLRDFHAAFVPATTYDRVDPQVPTFEELRRSYAPDPSHELRQWLAYVGDQPAGFAGLRLPVFENHEMAYAMVGVVPSLRRRGVGSLLYDQLVSSARAAGRRSLLSFVEARVGEISVAPGAAFAAARGFTARNTMLRRQLPLPVPPAKLDALAAKASSLSASYRLLTWVDACPESYVEQYARLKGLLLAEAPTGSVEWEPEKWDSARVRSHEKRLRQLGQTTYTAAALAPSGELAGHTQISLWEGHQGRASQQDTLVLRSHRGHRLGLALKVANLRAVQAACPDLTRISTANAEQNVAMVQVNEDLGFQVTEVLQMWQGPV